MAERQLKREMRNCVDSTNKQLTAIFNRPVVGNFFSPEEICDLNLSNDLPCSLSSNFLSNSFFKDYDYKKIDEKLLNGNNTQPLESLTKGLYNAASIQINRATSKRSASCTRRSPSNPVWAFYGKRLYAAILQRFAKALPFLTKLLPEESTQSLRVRDNAATSHPLNFNSTVKRKSFPTTYHS